MFGTVISFGSKLEISIQNLTKSTLFINTSSQFTLLCKKIDNLEFARRVNFEFIDSIEDIGTKYSLLFDSSCAEICTLRAFVDIDIALTSLIENYSPLSTTCLFKANLARCCAPEQEHCSLQISTVSAQMGLRSELVDWCRDASSVPYNDLIIDYEQTIDYVILQTPDGSIPLNFHIPNRQKQTKILHKQQTKVPTLQVFQSLPHNCKNFLLQSCPKFHEVSQRMCSKSSQKKPAKHKMAWLDKVSKRSSIALSNKKQLETENGCSGIRKRLTTHKSHYSSLL